MLLLFVTTVRSPAESRVVVSEVIELPSRHASEMGDVDPHNSTRLLAALDRNRGTRAVNSDRNRERREVTVVVARKGDDWGETGGGYWHYGFLLGLHSV